MTSSRRGRGFLVCAAASGALTLAAPPVARAGQVEPRELTIASQGFALDVGAVLDLTIGLPTGIDTATLGAADSDSHLVVRVHEDARSRDAVDAAGAGRLPRVVDSVDIPLSIDEADPRVSRPSATAVTLAIETESSTSTRDALQLETWGVYPLSIALIVDDETVADAATFVHRLRSPDEPAERGADVSVAIVLGQTVPPTIGRDGRVAPSPREVRELELLADALEAIDAASARVGVDSAPRAVRVEPSTLELLADVDPDLAARLVPAVEAGEVLAMPRLPFDPSSAVAAGREDTYTQLLREGEDVLRATVPAARIVRGVLLATDRISAAALRLRRDLGTQLVILPNERYEELDGSIGGFTDRSRVIVVTSDDDTQIPAMVIDPDIAALLASSDDPPLPRAITLVAELIALARELEQAEGGGSRHGFVLAKADGGVPDAALLDVVAGLLLQSDGVDVVAPSELASTVDRLLIDGRPLRVAAADTAGTPILDRLDAIDDIGLAVLGTASMVPEGQPVVEEWVKILGALPSTALTDAEAAAMILALRQQIDVYRNGVLGPEPYTFRVTGRTGTIPFELRNTTDVPLTVRVVISSAKLEFEQPDRTVLLPPGQDTEVRVDFRALSNGTSSVFLRIYTPAPDPSPQTQIVSDIILTVRVTALTGLAQLVTGAALLVLCTWWLRHWRQSRRRGLVGVVAPRHPAAAPARAALHGDPPADEAPRTGERIPTPTGNDADESTDGGNGEHPGHRAQDAAATTLPPS